MEKILRCHLPEISLSVPTKPHEGCQAFQPHGVEFWDCLVHRRVQRNVDLVSETPYLQPAEVILQL